MIGIGRMPHAEEETEREDDEDIGHANIILRDTLKAVRAADASMDIAASRLLNQKLVRTGCRTPEAVVAWLGAVQAQDYPGARWALGLRAKGVTDADVERACDEGRILRTHILRPTWHFVSPADIRWMLSVSGPRVNAVNAHYYRKSGLDAAVFARSRRAIERALAGGTHRTRLELAAVLKEAGIQAAGQRLAYLMMRAELDGVICSGARRGKQSTYALLDERAPRATATTREEALARLATRYFTSHGPATLRDYVWWSGLTVKDAKAGIDAAGKVLQNVTIDTRMHWLASSRTRVPAPGSTLHLLPNYDEYLIAYKDRGSIRDGKPAASVPVSIEFPHFLIIDGKLRGTWKRSLRAGRMVITLRLFRPLSRDERLELEKEAARFRRFAGVPVAVEATP